MSIRMEDVAKVLQAEPQGFDAIMLDVDNGPEGLTQKANSWLYSAGGLAACASSCGSEPPSCSATGCSASSNPSRRWRSPCTSAAEVTISVYSRACGANSRWK